MNLDNFMDLYVLDDDGNPLRIDDVIVWAQWFEQGQRRRVALGVFGDVRVSTVFLGIDHRFRFGGDDGPPVLWETMVFGGPLNHEMERYASLADALAGHALICSRVQQALVAP